MSESTLSQLDLEDLVLLIHTEVATAVTSAAVEGQMPQLTLSSVRVRMGQQESENFSLNTERYPVSDSGWLVDVTYHHDETVVAEGKSQLPSNEQWLASSMREYLAKQPCEWLSGVGVTWARRLKQLKLNTIGDFSACELSKKNINASWRRRLRQLQTLARLALSSLTLSIPRVIEHWPLIALLEDYSIEDLMHHSGYSKSQSQELIHWIQQLETCLDDQVFRQLTFKSLMPHDK